MNQTVRAGQTVDQRRHLAVFGVDAVKVEQIPSHGVGIVVEGVLQEEIGQRLDDRLLPTRMAEDSQVLRADFAGAERPQHPAAHRRTVEIPRCDADQGIIVVEDAQRRQTRPQGLGVVSRPVVSPPVRQPSPAAKRQAGRQPFPIVGVWRQFIQSRQAIDSHGSQ